MVRLSTYQVQESHRRLVDDSEVGSLTTLNEVEDTYPECEGCTSLAGIPD